jgi:hypothetical protein
MFTVYICHRLSLLIAGSDVGQFFKLKNIGEVFRKVPLPEDVTLKGLSLLKTSHDAVDWEYLRHHCLHVKEEVSFVTHHKDILRLS